MKYKFQQIEVDGENPDISVVQLMRAGTFDYYGDGTKMEITPDMFRSFKKNFDARTLGVDIAIDYFHNSHNEAAGWIREVTLKENDTQLWLKVEWTERAKEKILAKEIRYLSADFTDDWKNPETGVTHGPTLMGGGLTNRPFLKGMNAILHDLGASLDENGLRPEDIINGLKDFQRKKELNMNLSDVKKAAIVLNDAEKTELCETLGYVPKDTKLADENTSLKTQVTQLTAENKTLSDKVSAQAKEAEFSVLLSDGKAVPAQKDAYLAGDMAAFLKLAVSVNLDGKGSGDPKIKDKAGEPKNAAEAEDRLFQLSEAKSKSEKMGIIEARKIVFSENPELVKLAGHAA